MLKKTISYFRFSLSFRWKEQKEKKNIFSKFSQHLNDEKTRK